MAGRFGGGVVMEWDCAAATKRGFGDSGLDIEGSLTVFRTVGVVERQLDSGVVVVVVSALIYG